MLGAAGMLVVLWTAEATPAPAVTKAAAAARRQRRADFIAAALAANTPADRGGLVSEEAQGEGVIAHDHPFLLGGTRVSWRGRCLAQIKEALPEPTPLPPATCLDDTIITETDAPGRIEDFRVEALVRRDWPRAFRRLARWQRQLAEAARLDPINGEEAHWRCAQLLVDACTGDVAEVCTGISEEEPRCPGRHLPDGRCRRYELERLPLSR